MRGLSLAFAYTALGGSVAMVAGEIPALVLAVLTAAFFTGMGVDSGRLPKPPLPGAVVVGAALAGILLSFLGMHAGNFYGRMIGILGVMTAAKLVSAKSGRDVLQIYLLNLLILASAAARRFGLEYGALVLAETFLSVAGLVFLYGSREQDTLRPREVRHLLAWSSGITLGLLPATLVFFLVLPRPTAAIFGWETGSASRTGFNERINAGEVESILQDRSPAFRVRWLQGDRPETPRWRGMVYGVYRDGVWEQAKQGPVPAGVPSGPTVDYEVLMEPSGSRALFALGVPTRVRSGALETRLTAQLTLEAQGPVRKRAAYRVVSVLADSLPPGLPPAAFLEVPDVLEARLGELASRFRGTGPLETARALSAHLQTEYDYDASPGAAGDREPVLRFLFDTPRGHCESFASALALLLRSIAIPARVVGGYAGGEWNEMGGYTLVRQSRAHTWVEAWIPERGWMVLDPTPARGAPSPGWRLRLAQWVDFLRYTWYRWVVTYDLGRQLDLARRTVSTLESVRSRGLEGALPSARALLPWLAAAASVPGLLWALRRLRRWWRRRPRGWGERFVRLLERRGMPREPGETLQELAERLAREEPELRHAAAAFVREYYRAEYRGETRRGQVEARFRRLESALG